MKTIPPIRGVLFDLDGTLLDTLEDIGGSVNRVLARRGLPVHPIDAYRDFVGEGARVLILRALPESHRDDGTVHDSLAEYRETYARHWNETTKPYAGIPDLLDALAARGLTLGILSNKPHDMTRRCAEHYLSRWSFAAVLGQRDDVARKPDPGGALEAARLMGLKPAEILYVGDTGIDMETARVAGMFPLGVTWGFRPESELRAHGAQIIARQPAEVLAQVILPAGRDDREVPGA
jgi:phosphoglycolate phosphatase